MANVRIRTISIDPEDEKKHESYLESVRQSIREDDAES